MHDGNTSQLGGLKPGCRQDSAHPNLYWIGIFKSANKRIQPPPLIEVSFATAPDTSTVVEALRTAVDVSIPMKSSCVYTLIEIL